LVIASSAYAHGTAANSINSAANNILVIFFISDLLKAADIFTLAAGGDSFKIHSKAQLKK
jgi:hypothetical protein